jgi:hypothetical protein
LQEITRSPHEAEELVVRTVQRDSAALLRLANTHSICQDDAQDAYQRALEIFLRNAARLDADNATSWLRTVVKHEAWEVRKQRQKLVGPQEMDLDRLESRVTGSPEDEALSFESVTQAAEALTRLKPQELTALWMQASGRSYKTIAADLDWSYTKVNRCIAEGRRSFLKHVAAIETGEACARWLPVLNAVLDGEASEEDAAALRPHLRSCGACRATAKQMRRSRSHLAAVLPVALVVDPATTQVEHVLGLFARTYEAVAHFATERTTASAMKLQAVLDAASAGKVTAVAASAAALAGGGAATVERAVDSGRAPAHRAGPDARQRRLPVHRLAAAVAGAPAAAAPTRTPVPAARWTSAKTDRTAAASDRRAAHARDRAATRTARATAEFTGMPSGVRPRLAASAAPTHSAAATPAPAAAPAAAPPAPVAPATSGFERASAPPTFARKTSAAAREFAP